jgi:2,4-diketo-3-deoxy-L-fuconate hydrolase
MRLARLGERGAETPVVIGDGKYFSISSLTDDIDSHFWISDGINRVGAALDAGDLAELDATGLRIGSPIVRPSSIICIGMNYAAHAAEGGALPPTAPIVFHKAPNTMGGPNDAVPIPRGSKKTDWEVELGVVVGRRASYLESPSDAKDHIGGFVTVNDLSEREFQLEISGGQWSKGKSSEGFCPTGPVLVTPDEVDARSLRLRSWINGEIRQDSSTADLIFDVNFLIYSLSQYMVLEPGDLICTGTPEGVALSGRFPYLTAGDVLDIEIEGLGRQSVRFIND